MRRPILIYVWVDNMEKYIALVHAFGFNGLIFQICETALIRISVLFRKPLSPTPTT